MLTRRLRAASHHLSFRLALIAVLLALVVGVSMSVIQFSLQFRQQLQALELEVARILQVAGPPAARAVETRDQALAGQVVEGVLHYPYVMAVAVGDNFDQVLSSGSRLRPYTRSQWLTHLLTDNLSTEQLELPLSRGADVQFQGLLTIRVDRDLALQTFYRQSLWGVGIGLLRSALLAVLLFGAVHLWLAVPLMRMARAVRSIDPEHPDGQRLPVPAQHQHNEVGQLAASTNQLLQSVEQTLIGQRSVEQDLRKAESHIRQIIDSLPVLVGARNIHGEYVFANRALADVLGCSADGAEGRALQTFQRTFQASWQQLLELDRAVIENQSPACVLEETWLSANGETLKMLTHVSPMQFYDQTVALVVASDVTELKRTQAKIEHMAYHDALTDLPNRSYLMERLEEELRRAQRHEYFGALLFIDLDQFKSINDSLGHPVGDGLLRELASRLKEVTRNEDLVVRLGGDEFVVVLTYLDEQIHRAFVKAEEIAQKIRVHLSQVYHYEDMQLHLTCSIGAIVFPEKNTGGAELLQYADAAMYQVKSQGKDGIRFFNRYMSTHARDTLIMEGDLRNALKEEQFELFFQPRISSVYSHCVGAEALLRWRHPTQGIIPPERFISIMESSEMIVDVGLWVIDQACRQLHGWLSAGLWHKPMRLGVNISPRQFRSARFARTVTQIAQRQGVSMHYLEMEVTESMAMHNPEETIKIIEQLNRTGIRFALDDFGTGYSSLSHLKRLPISVLKIDQSFVKDMLQSHSGGVLVETIVTMGKRLGLEVVAEGVETKAQIERLCSYGCDYYQGYYSSQPLPAAHFAQSWLIPPS